MSVVPPRLNLKAFNCPHCNVLANQVWTTSIRCAYSYRSPSGTTEASSYEMHLQHSQLKYAFSKCSNCLDVSFWRADTLIYPNKGKIEAPNPDLPEEIKADYIEARDIINLSPRSSAALLRLALQRMMKHVGEKGSNINDDIKSLVKRGLPIQLQQALDSIRVIGNNAVHPGQIEINDNPEIAQALFGMLNVICDYFITQPNKIAEIYGALPEKDLNNIAKRDGSPT